jgi:tetratricopeptide (TPR) repeat protein
MIQSLSGVTDESMGRTTNATSGKAIIARQEQGALATAPLFDNLRMARAFHGEKRLSLVEQFMSEQKQFRVTNQRGNPDYVTINDGLPENDIVRTKADFKISEAEFNATARQAQAEALLNVVLQLAPVAPQLALLLLDLIVEKMDIPNGEEIVKRIRSITGAEDPDADPENPTPEMQAKAQAKAAEAQMAQRAAEANVAKIEGEAALKLSQADKAKADAEKVIRSLPKDTLDNFANALQIAIQMLQAAGAVDTADALIAVANAAPAAQPAAPMAGVPMPQGAPMAPEQPMPGQPMPVDPGMMPV